MSVIAAPSAERVAGLRAQWLEYLSRQSADKVLAAYANAGGVVTLLTVGELRALLAQRQPASHKEIMQAWLQVPTWAGDSPEYFIAGWKARERYDGIAPGEGEGNAP